MEFGVLQTWRCMALTLQKLQFGPCSNLHNVPYMVWGLGNKTSTPKGFRENQYVRVDFSNLIFTGNPVA